MQRFLWCALIGIVIGCGDDDDNKGPDPNANDAATDVAAMDAAVTKAAMIDAAVMDVAVMDAAVKDAAVRAPTPAEAANKVCATRSGCTDGSLSMSDCVQQRTAHFTYSVGPGCYGCLAEVTCSGWRAIDTGKTGQCSVCPDCCMPVDAGSSPTPECEPGQASMPFSSTDPCPQNDPVCPPSMYMAVAACDESGRWQRDAASLVMCSCVPIADAMAAVCKPGQASTPGSPDDPCPQNDPVCPASMYMAVATCDASGQWQKDAASLIQCACVLAER